MNNMIHLIVMDVPLLTLTNGFNIGIFPSY